MIGMSDGKDVGRQIGGSGELDDQCDAMELEGSENSKRNAIELDK